MWHFVRLCWRDLWRNRRRTLLVGFVITFAVGVMILFIGLGTGGHNLMIQNATSSFLGHAQIQRVGFLEQPDLEHQIPGEELERLGKVLDASEEVQGWAPRIATGGLMSKKLPEPKEDDTAVYREMTSEGAFLVGVMPSLERRVSVLEKSLLPDDPVLRCQNGCVAALAEIYASAEPCESLCSGVETEFAEATCGDLALRVCQNRCPVGDELCFEEACRERFADYCQPARFLLEEDPQPDEPYRGEVVLGVTLAKVLDVHVGDRVAVTTGTAQGRAFASLYRVAGLVRTGSLEINRTFALTNYRKLAEGLELPGAASFVVLSVGDPDQATEVAAHLNLELEKRVPDVIALGWPKLSPEMDIFVKIDQGGLLIMLGLLIAIIGVILANIVTMSVMERTREYGVRLAVGESHGRLFAGLMVETALLALTFSLMGALLGEAANFYFFSHPIDFGMGEFETSGVVMETRYPSVPTWYGFYFSVGTVVLFSLAGALYPARRVLRLRPVDALRFV